MPKFTRLAKSRAGIQTQVILPQVGQEWHSAQAHLINRCPLLLVPGLQLLKKLAPLESFQTKSRHPKGQQRWDGSHHEGGHPGFWWHRRVKKGCGGQADPTEALRDNLLCAGSKPGGGTASQSRGTGARDAGTHLCISLSS